MTPSAMNTHQGFLDYFFTVSEFSEEQQRILLQKLQDAVLSQFVAGGVLDRETVQKLSDAVRDGMTAKSLNLDALAQVFSPAQQKTIEDVLNKVCEALEDTFLANSTRAQKEQMLALLES